MADDILGNIDKKFDLGKTSAKSAVNQTFVIGLAMLLIDKGLVTKEEIVGVIANAAEATEKRLEIAESLSPNQTAGAKADADRQKIRIRKEYKILRKRFET